MKHEENNKVVHSTVLSQDNNMVSPVICRLYSSVGKDVAELPDISSI